MLSELKGKFYHTTIGPVILYGTICRAVKSSQEHELSVAEMWMFWCINRHTRHDRLRNECIKRKK